MVALAADHEIAGLNRDRGFDRGMGIVTDEGEIFEAEVVNVFDRRIQFHPRKRTRGAGELFARLREMISIKVKIAKSVNEIATR